MTTLIHYPLCPFSRSIRLGLAEAGIPFTLSEERPWEWRSEFLAINPAGDLPVLLYDNKAPLCGAYVICEYLDEMLSEGHREARAFSFFPGPPVQRAEVRRLTDWFHRKFASEVGAYLLEEKLYGAMAGHGSPQAEHLRAGRKNLRQHLDYIGHLSASRSWLAGVRMSYADLTAAAHLSCLDYLGDVPWEDFPGAKEWYVRVKSRPSFRPLLAERLPGQPPPAHYANLDF